MPDLLEPPAAIPRKPGVFTAESARKAAAASVAARRLNAQRLKAIAQAALDNPQPLAQPPAQVDDYSARRIMRVRQQLDRIDAMLMEEGMRECAGRQGST